MYAYLILKPESIELVPSEGYKFTLEELHSGADCDTIQIVRSSADDNLLMCLDDNGKLSGKPFNNLATGLYAPEYDFIVGDVVLGTALSPYYMDEPDIYKMEYEVAKELKDTLERFLEKLTHICGN